MATNRLRTKRFIPTPGTTQFVIPGMNFCRPVLVVRNNVVNFLHFITSSVPVAVNNDVMFRKTHGQFKFDPTNPFNAGEEVFIIYKVPLL